MKKLWIVRHAKSSWDDFNLADHDRPLNKRGKNDAPLMAQKIKDDYPTPKMMISSTAKRAFTTCRTFNDAFELPKSRVVKDANLYHPSIADCLGAIHKLDDAVETGAIFGHNPTFTYLIHELTNEGPDNLPTCGCALITSDAKSWDTFESGICELTTLIYPKMFKREK